MQYNLCRHIMTNGTQCGSPALDRDAFCFYHHRLHRRHAAFRHKPSPPGSGSLQLELSPLEDRDSIQSALSLVIHALAAGQLETRRATALFYGLQLASMNAARLNSAPFPADVLVETTSGADGLDLALPGATRTIATNIADEVYDKDEYQDGEEEDEEEEDEDEENREEEDKEETGQEDETAPRQSELLRAQSYASQPEPPKALPPPTYPLDTAQSTHS